MQAAAHPCCTRRRIKFTKILVATALLLLLLPMCLLRWLADGA
jgi:hypothetical protein